MSKKTFTLFIVVLVAVIAGVFWFFFFRTPQGEQVSPGTDNPDLFPFGQGEVTVPSGEESTGTDTVIDLTDRESPLPALRQIWKDPNAGAAFVTVGAAESIRFVDRATGHIYGAQTDAAGVIKISNVTVPRIYEALWAPSGREVILRYLKDDVSIQTFYGLVATTTATSTETTVEGYFLPAGIKEIAALGNKVMYLNPAAPAGSVIVSNMDGTSKLPVMSSEAREWLISWNSPASAFIASKPSGVVPGYGYIMNASTGALTKIASGILGLTGSISPDGSRVLMSAHESGGVATGSYSVADKTTSSLPIATLSDKCAWSREGSSIAYCGVPTYVPAGTYPDDWYQGNVSFSDKLWKVDLATGEADIVSDLTFDAAGDMDMFKLSLSADDSYLLFTNKKDMSLWLYQLK